MNWINPRDKLPEPGQLIWCLFIENREGERCGLPSAMITIGEAKKDRYGVTFVAEITHKGYPNYSKRFFDWWHFDQSEKEPGTNEHIYKGFSSIDDSDNIVAWIPFKELPEWDYIGIEESIAIISKTEEYKKGVEHDKTERIIERATGNTNRWFIYLKEAKPTEKGCYVVANKNGVWLSNFDPSEKEKWLAPNGEPVIVWYPIPNSY
jgi:hypothetical protein